MKTNEPTDAALQTGHVVTHFGAQVDVEKTNGDIIRCHLRKNVTPAITGDRVMWQYETKETGSIVEVLPRRTLLARPDERHKLKPIAANIDAIVIVTAPSLFSEYFMDRYLVAAHFLKIPCAIVLNKIDLLNEITRADLLKRLSVYEKIALPVILSSTRLPDGLLALNDFLHHKTCVLVGTSGVGKSSLIATYLPDQAILVGETAKKGLGKHTTTTSRLYHLPHGGQVIDSPGVREFGLGQLTPNDVLAGFVEFSPYLGQCKFRNCRHQKEPGCALQQAVLQGKISGDRLKSYFCIIDQI